MNNNTAPLTANEIKNLRTLRHALADLADVTTLRPDGRIRRTPEFNTALHIAALADDAFLTRPDKWGHRSCARQSVWSEYCAVRAKFAEKSRLNDRLLNILENHLYKYRRTITDIRFAR